MSLVLCCSVCYFLNNHSGHKLLFIDNKESFKKENLTIDSSSKDVNNIIENANKIKEKIEKEIFEIDKSYDEVFSSITNFYEIKINNLKIEEKNLKEDLQNEVTKTKEKIEIFLSDINKIIKDNEQIIKGLKTFENEEKNMIKTLSYISKINKNKKDFNNKFGQLIGNLKIYFDEDNKKIKYEKYYFNGIQVPINIQFKDVSFNSLKIFWDIEEVKIIDVDKKQIRFIVEMKEENGKYIKKYEGNDKNCLIENLNENTKYEIRICSVYNDINGIWSESKEIKTIDIDMNINSKILDESNKKYVYLKKLYEWSGMKKLKLIYRGSRDGTNAKVFHEKCDDQAPTLCLYKNEKGNIFGGYTTVVWRSSNGDTYYPDKDSFMFTLSNIYGIEPTKFQIVNFNRSILTNGKEGPTFGGNPSNAGNPDIGIYSDYNKGDSFSGFPESYKDNLGKGRSIFTGNENNSKKYFKVKEIEIFKAFE